MKGKIFKSVVFISLLLASLTTTAQQKKYIYKRYGKVNGLVADMAFAVAQDKRGFIWIATDKGLQRYDGKRFVTLQHNPADPHSIPSNDIGGLHVDKKGRLWLLLSGNRVGQLNTSNFRYSPARISIPGEYRRNNMVKFKETEEGAVYFSVQDYGILTYDEKTNEFSAANNAIQQTDSLTIFDFTKGPQKNEFLLTTKSGIALYNTESKKWNRGLPYSFLDSINRLFKNKQAFGPGNIFTDKKGRFWFDTWLESKTKLGPDVYNYEPARQSWKSYKKSLDAITGDYYSITGFLEQRNGEIWVYGTNLFARFNAEKEEFEDVRNEYLIVKGIDLETIYNLFEDKDGNIWISSSNGLFIFNPGRQIFSNLSNKRKGTKRNYKNSVDAVLQTADGTIYASAWGEGIFVYDKNFNELPNPFIVSKNENLGFSGWDMHERKNGEIWVGMQGGIVKVYSPDIKKTVTIKLPVFNNRTVRQVAEDHKGNMWMGTQYGAIIKCANADWRNPEKSFSLARQLSGRITRLVVDKAGFLWVCTDRYGLYKLDTNDGSIVAHFDEESAPGSRLQTGGVNDIYQYNDSLFLIASGGLNLLNSNTNKITLINTGKETELSFLSSIIRDRLGYIWLAYKDGLCRMRINDQIFLCFGEEDGISNFHFQVNASTVLNDGRILFGTSTDMLIFDPAKIQVPATAAKVSISGFTVAEKSLLVDSLLKLNKITLPYFKNSFSIDLTTFTYQDDYAILYMLEGLEDKWQVSSSQRLTYSFLPPGNYVLRTKTVTAAGKESEETAVHIKIIPPFWKSWWFYGLLVLSGIGIFYLADRERLLRIRATQRLRTDIALSLHEEVNTELNNINMLSEMARMKADKDIDRSKALIEQISEKSNDMIIALDDMLWVIDPANDSMENTLLRMAEFADALRNRHEAEIETHIDKEVQYIKPEMKLRHGFFIIFKTALRCVVQTAGAKKVLVNIDYEKNLLCLTMQGNTTMKNTDNNIQKCIADMKLHAANINAELDIHNEKNGTNIVLIMPVK